MSKIYIVAKREFRETVRKKSFLIITCLLPILMAGLITVPSLLMSRSAKQKHIVLIDGTGRLEARIRAALAPAIEEDDDAADEGEQKEKPQSLPASPPTPALILEVRAADDIETASKVPLADLTARTIDAVVTLPNGILTNTEKGIYYSRSSTDLITRRTIEGAVHQAILEVRFADRGIADEDAALLLGRVRLQSIQLSRTGETKKSSSGDFMLGFLFAMMMFIPLVFHGQAILHGVIQEKADRIVETLVSSMTAFELLTGKVLGMAVVGLLQIGIWSIMGLLLSFVGAGTLLAIGVNPLQFLTPMKLVLFLVYFILGYFMYACVYAAGGACVNSEKEAQQVLMPVFMVLWLPWLLAAPILMDPDSTFATVFSMAPLLAPLAMFLRVIVGEPAGWQIVVSIVVSLATIVALFWVAAKIFRIGILWYGKRPSLPEFFRWLRHP